MVKSRKVTKAPTMMMNDVRNEGESFPVDAPQNFAEKTFKRFL
jgi:hypothetical protein